jgi:hypothetical protein
MTDFERLTAAFGVAGGDQAVLADSNTPHLVAVGHSILSARQVPGLEVATREERDGIHAKVRIRAGIQLAQPLHLCFGVLHKHGTQRIHMDVVLERGASATFIAHCLFPDATKVRHLMEAQVEIGEEAQLRYTETHYHGPHGGVEVVPKAQINIARAGRYSADFTLIVGRVGMLAIDYSVEVGEEAVCELLARVFAHADDKVQIKEKIVLAGHNARGLIKSRVALEDDAYGEITGITEGHAAGARGHVDCLEIVKDRAVARAIPIVHVTHPGAKVTHEAAIGSVDQRQLETLMAHGLTPEEAVEVIVKGILT